MISKTTQDTKYNYYNTSKIVYEPETVFFITGDTIFNINNISTSLWIFLAIINFGVLFKTIGIIKRQTISDY